MPRKERVGPEMVALRGVVVDDVQDHLEPRRVQPLDHGLELADAARRRITHVGREESYGVVAPVVLEPLIREMLVVHKRVDGHQLDGRHPELLEVLYGRGRGETGVGTAQILRYVRMPLRKPLDVELVDNGLVPRRAGRPVVAPGKGRIHDPALGHPGGVVLLVEGQVLLLGAEPVPEVRDIPSPADPTVALA